MNTIRDQSMVALYGSSAANGVIMVQTKSGSAAVSPAPITMPYLESVNAMRVNFHDDAFWQPKLTTDAMGKASFDISYPDDITNWKTFLSLKGQKILQILRNCKLNPSKLFQPIWLSRDSLFGVIDLWRWDGSLIIY
ncbi:hypothetical protein KUH03_29585 [Sphingobacterium sp. E70]|uniref:alpha-2-macroglobulin family protein n=1 Tax=Sphingobacterium sp. E70 TaxID=2853439 RepID=UPI00211C4073|nr:alpha-2-macroglobulin family protein [Sphingobacterium sp. E70]ULT23326.1 hypothetical protein KUH03_29585 [Sphingobacterium sp. E70]